MQRTLHRTKGICRTDTDVCLLCLLNSCPLVSDGMVIAVLRATVTTKRASWRSYRKPNTTDHATETTAKARITVPISNHWEKVGLPKIRAIA